MESIFTRRSVREFTEESIEAGKLEKILRAAMQAPSAGNQQPWEFIAVQGKDNLAMLAQYNPYAGCLKEAAVGIIVLGNTDYMTYPKHWEQDLGAVTQNILLEATHLGLGSVWLGANPVQDRMDYICELYGLSGNLIPYSVIAIGYPKNKDANKFIDRFDARRVRYVGN